MNLAKLGNNFVTVNGKLLKLYKFPNAELLADFCSINGTVYNLATGKKFYKFTGEDGYFKGNGTTNIISNKSLSSFTIVMIADKPLTLDYNNYFAVNGHTVYPIRGNYYTGSSFNWNDYDKSLSPTQYFGITEYAFPTLSKRLMTPYVDEFLAYARNSETKEIFIQQNEVQTIETYTDDLENLNSIILLSGKRYKRFMIFDSALSFEEIQQICELRYGDNDYKYVPPSYFKGIDGLGCPNNFYAYSSQLPEWGEDTEIEYEIIAQENATVSEDMTTYTALYFINPIQELKIGEMYNIEAHPFPYEVTATPYNVEYETSDASVLECYKGFLIAKKEGSATITAKISNTDIVTSLSISVVSKIEEIINYFVPTMDYTDENGNSLNSEDPEEMLKAIVSAIYEGKEKGYNGIRFPKTVYHIKPFQKEAHCNVPTEYTIDFNGSTIYIEDNDYCHCEAGAVDQSDGYTLFKFGSGDYDTYYDDPCEYSVIKNATVYGERYKNTTYAESEYTEFTRFVTFGCRSVGCKVQDMYFDSCCGFHIDTGTNGYKVWSGTSSDGARRGCTLAEDFESGRLAEDGETITEKTGWYYTNDYIKIGYVYGKRDYTGIIKYKLGLMGYITYGITGRWYDIFFFDENKKLISAGINQFGLETYDFPENAVYMKVNIMTGSTPNNSTTTDVPAVIRLYPSVDPDLFVIENCKFINPHASAISLTGGTRGLIKNCYAQQGARYGWSIDFEDGWLGMRHNMIYKVMCNGMVTFPGGHNTAVVSSCISVGQYLGDTENLRHINCVYGSLRIKSKTNDTIEGCIIKTYTPSYTYEGVSTIREINTETGVTVNI